MMTDHEDALGSPGEVVREVNQAEPEPIRPANQQPDLASLRPDPNAPRTEELRTHVLPDGTVAIVKGDVVAGVFEIREALAHQNGSYVHVDPDEAPGIIDGTMGYPKQWSWLACTENALL